MTVCVDCGGTVIEYDAAAGNGFCVNCGTVVEENTIINEITFGETSSGAAMVQGSFVAQGATHARMGGPFGNRGSSESREQTIANASRKIQQVASALRLSEVVQLAATRLYTLAVEHRFTKGRKSMNVVAICLYVACRQKETRNYMLIDFSDLLQVNVFELGHTYLQLVQTLNMRLPLVDPSHYISRFAALLEFGDETPQVALDATRLVQRFDRDWMTRGRRPSGICGAALLLAARMNNFRRSVEEVVQVVKIADSTLRKRVEEFRRTGSAQLSVADFRSVWLEEEMDPPAYTKGREKEAAVLAAVVEGDEEEGTEPGKGKGRRKAKGKGKKRKRKRGEDSEDEETAEVAPPTEGTENGRESSSVDHSLLNQGILAGVVVDNSEAEPAPTSQTEEVSLPPANPPPLFLPDVDEQTDASHFDPALLDPVLLPTPSGSSIAGTAAREDAQSPPALSIPLIQLHTIPPSGGITPSTTSPNIDESILHTVLTTEVASFLTTPQSLSLAAALDQADTVRQAQFIGLGDDELQGLDEEELDALILTEEEVKVKERVWVELNRDYLEALAAKQEAEANGESSAEKKTRKRRRTTSSSHKPRDGTTPHGATAAESVRNLIKKNPRYSKRINYDVLKDLFVMDEEKDVKIVGGAREGRIANVTGVAPLWDGGRSGSWNGRYEDDGDEDEDGHGEIDGGETDRESMYPISGDDIDYQMHSAPLVVVEEGGGGVGERKMPDEVDGDADADADAYGRGEEVEWEGYEQEV